MYIQLKNIITDDMIKKFIAIYKRRSDKGNINKKVLEFRTNWDTSVDTLVKNYLNSQVIPLAKETWNFKNFHYTNIKIREYPTGSFYEPHVDFHHPQPSNIYLSFSIILNNEFQGGELVLGNQKFDNGKYNGMLFDATQTHEVLPIKSGARMALIGHLIATKH